MTRNHVFQVCIIALCSCSVLFVIEQILDVNYFIKTVSKVFFFLVIPILYIRYICKRTVKESFNIQKVRWKSVRLGFLFGSLAFGIILLTYWVLRSIIDTDAIMYDLQERSGITPEIFIFVALYITFGNSLMEEFYFRGFLFLNVYKTGYKVFAHVFSAFLFAVYHTAIFATWFSFELMLLALAGLFIAGILFNWLNTYSQNFLNSWIFHIMADIAIILIGLHLYGIL
ncbi:MAG TPA: CPBP family intramembrane glutamic endopeptidase [Bacillus sp. (in: firmicutes)]|uniref:CPBP family intramembrane glutamic endopeptidase n=1 Tax=Bacillus litorisediminis TaxID=2922713 RepID=UPI001FAFE7AD|nr:CPBP family intramembrane glutamic endopeptidase [Bacillus litorisediminis]HWO74571.1 CPBP family intramembrane glutamic endopeptidase [Bacillus sp. (in: firmicutes)]